MILGPAPAPLARLPSRGVISQSSRQPLAAPRRREHAWDASARSISRLSPSRCIPEAPRTALPSSHASQNGKVSVRWTPSRPLGPGLPCRWSLEPASVGARAYTTECSALPSCQVKGGFGLAGALFRALPRRSRRGGMVFFGDVVSSAFLLFLARAIVDLRTVPGQHTRTTVIILRARF